MGPSLDVMPTLWASYAINGHMGLSGIVILHCVGTWAYLMGCFWKTLMAFMFLIVVKRQWVLCIELCLNDNGFYVSNCSKMVMGFVYRLMIHCAPSVRTSRPHLGVDPKN